MTLMSPRHDGIGVDLFSGLEGENHDWGGEKSDNGANTLYVYLLTYINLYKNTAYFGGGGNNVFARTIYYWGQSPTCPYPRIDAPCMMVYMTIYIQ